MADGDCEFSACQSSCLRLKAVPFARHSSLPELRNFVQQFQPTSVSLNTLLSADQLYHLHRSFAGTVLDAGIIQTETRAWFAAHPSFGERWLQAMDSQTAAISSSDPAELISLLGLGGMSHVLTENVIALLGGGRSFHTLNAVASPATTTQTSGAEIVKAEPPDFPSGVLMPARGIATPRRKKRRTTSRPPSKYAVDAASLSRLIKRSP